MEYQGNILKMDVEMSDPVRYCLPVGGRTVDMNVLINRRVNFAFDGQINCIACGKRTKTSFGQGYCFSCFKTVPEADESVVSPQLSRAEFGIARDMEWSQKNDLIDHFVYLAVSREVKVGVTRSHHVPDRWIDQGASYAIKLARTPNRHIAGIIEVFLKRYMTDKTSWKEMLQNNVDHSIDLVAEKEKALGLLPSELQQYRCDDSEIARITYPVVEYPKKAVSLSFDREASIGGILKGIKGQYLMFDGGKVVNMRRHSGYFLTMRVD